MASKYLNYEGLAHFLEKIRLEFAPIQAIIFKSTVEDIASLPALNSVQPGWMYNIKTGGLTTADFVEGEGHIVADGENVAAVELYTGEYTPVASPASTDDPKALEWYEVDTTTTYYRAVTPVGTEDPSSEGWFEFSAVTPAGSEDPSAQGWFELDGVHYVLSTDTVVDSGKTYYAGAVTADTSVDPSHNYFEEVTEVTYKLSEDRIPQAGKTYYTAGKIKKWDLMGGVFDLEDRYLEFGDKFPQGPASRMVDGRTFLYMGETVKAYTYVADPEGRPSENGYFEGTFAAVTDTATIYNPHQQGLYEEDAVLTGVYVLSEDQEYDNTKTYFAGTFVASTDPTVDPLKKYYTEEDLYKKASIYEYDATAHEWIQQSSGGTDMVPITNAEIDELFI